MSARIAVLISGRGRNLQALIAACAERHVDGEIVVVVSNRADAAGLAYARVAGIVTVVVAHRDYPDRAAYDAALAAVLEAHRADLVVLAGFMRILTAGFVSRYRGRLINIHPSLLPRHPGLDTHRRALEAGDAEHGATVHFVTEEVDAGPAIIQGKLKVHPEDTAETLADRVLQEIEVRIYPQAVAWLVRGEVTLEGRAVRFRGHIMNTPPGLEALEAPFR
ncbi:MAG: phosphoribosylglycinamide formyltransferase [Pseudomonadota bacterium]